MHWTTSVGGPQSGRQQVRGGAAFNFGAGQLYEILKSEFFGPGAGSLSSFVPVKAQIANRSGDWSEQQARTSGQLVHEKPATFGTAPLRADSRMLYESGQEPE
jgi:hypothetical protein